MSIGGWVTGQVLLDGENIYAPGSQRDPAAPPRRAWYSRSRRRFRPSRSTTTSPPAWCSRAAGRAPSSTQVVERSLRRAALWDEVKDRLHGSAMALSGGQQQRLCLARTIAPEPEVILLDEPTASLDPQGTQRIEELVFELKGDFTIIIVTHNMQQAARVSDTTTFFYLGTHDRTRSDQADVHHAARTSRPRRTLREGSDDHDTRCPWRLRSARIAPRAAVEPHEPAARNRRTARSSRSRCATSRSGTVARRRCSDVSLTVPRRAVTALIGPSGCGKSTFLRSINRMNDLIPDTRDDGELLVEGVVGLRPRRSTWSRIASASAWSSSARTRFPSRSSHQQPLVRVGGAALERLGVVERQRDWSHPDAAPAQALSPSSPGASLRLAAGR